jgi:hypothetical protein
MEALIFACPRTHRPIEPGISVDQEIFCDFQSVIISVRCPHCWARHALTIREGVLASGAPHCEALRPEAAPA